MNYLEIAKSLHDEIIENRRYLHRNPEIGFDLPKTSAFVINKLEEYGYDDITHLLEHGFYVEVGNGDGKRFFSVQIWTACLFRKNRVWSLLQRLKDVLTLAAMTSTHQLCWR